MIPSAKPPTLLATLCVLIFHVAGPGSTRGETQPSKEFEAHGVISRSWTHDEISYSTVIRLNLPKGKAGTGLVSFVAPGTGGAKLTVRLNLQGEVPLRPGEEEHFSVAVTHVDPGGSGKYLLLQLRPSRSVWYYRDPEGPISFERKVPVWGGGGNLDARFTLAPIRRRVIVPPNTISKVGVFKPSQEDRIVLSWVDKGNPGTVSTDLAYTIWKVRPLWWDKKIATGTVSVGPEGLATLDLAPGSPVLVDPQAWFQNRNSYRVEFRLKRSSEEYRDQFGPDEDISFSFQSGGFRIEEKTEFGRALDGALTPPDRTLARYHSFLELDERR